MRKLKEIIMQKMFSQYDDPNLWIDKYVNNPSVSDDELKHLRAVMQRDLALKKADSERIHELVGMFPPKLRPELLRSSVNQLRSKNPAVPGSGLTESSKSENSGNFSAVDESQGEIDVSMEYNVQGNQLAIMLWALRNLTIRKRILGILHSTIRLLPENTKYDLKLPHPEKRNGLYSNYLRSVCFLVHTSDLNKKMVLIQIWFKKGITSRKLIGESFIPVKEYNMILGHKQTFHLFKGKDSISNVPLNSTYYGEIKVALRFAISVNQKRMVRIAEEAIDLCGTLEVWIKEGMNLISPISGRDVNLFVTVSLTDGNENTEYRSTDCVQRSDQPFWNSILRFSNQHLSDIYESKLKITIWNRINSFKPAEQLGVVKICTKGREYDFKTLLTADDDEGVSQCSTKKSNASLWEAVQSKPGTWVEQILKVHAPISK
ncbi:unnamed protein product [Heterobilharzia americana]|nr:unnamed protein product [Heterobilharzia americana]